MQTALDLLRSRNPAFRSLEVVDSHTCGQPTRVILSGHGLAPGTDPAALEKLSEFWRRCGSNIDTMDAEHHDMVLAIVSHLPHIIAYNIVGTADDLESVAKGEVIKYAASGFRDFTRLAASDPTMWRDVCLHNKDAILEMLARFSEDLASLQRAIRWGDGEKLFDLFTRTRGIRRSIIEAGQETAAPDFGRHKERE